MFIEKYSSFGMRKCRDRAWAYLVFGMIGLSLGCRTDEKKTITSQLLEGRWELQVATVNGEGTDRLRNLYFVFLPDTSLQTNIMGSEQNFKYRLTEDDVIHQSSDPPLVYAISEVTDSTIAVETEIRKSVFSITLAKAKPKVAIDSFN